MRLCWTRAIRLGSRPLARRAAKRSGRRSGRWTRANLPPGWVRYPAAAHSSGRVHSLFTPGGTARPARPCGKPGGIGDHQVKGIGREETAVPEIPGENPGAEPVMGKAPPGDVGGGGGALHPCHRQASLPLQQEEAQRPRSRSPDRIPATGGAPWRTGPGPDCRSPGESNPPSKGGYSGPAALCALWPFASFCGRMGKTRKGEVLWRFEPSPPCGRGETPVCPAAFRPGKGGGWWALSASLPLWSIQAEVSAFVPSEYGGRGVFSALLRWAEEACRERGTARVLFSCDGKSADGQAVAEHWGLE